jgi:arylsulfatase A-like enzyme
VTNILLIVSDQHRRDACGVYGSPVRRRDGSSPTPNIDRLAARGTVFDRAICNSPLCAPSRASFLTGLHPHSTTALYHKMLEREAGLARFPGVRDRVRTMADYFRAAGYRTGAIGKMHVHGEEARGWDLGFDVRELRFYTQAPGLHYSDARDGDLNRRYRELPPYRDRTYREIDPQRYAEAPPDLKVAENTLNQHRLETLVEREEDMFDHLVADRSLAFLEDCAAGKQPFFLHVGFEKPHEPWSVHRKYLDLFDPDAMPLPAAGDDWREHGRHAGIPDWQHTTRPPDEMRAIIASYHACVAEMDHELGRVIDRCAELGLLDNTVIIYTSDHGELLFDHGLIYKHNYFASSVDVPLVLAGPGVPAGQRCSAPVSLVDLLPTLLDFAGLPPSAEAEGQSVRPAMADRFDPDRPLFAEFHQSGSAAWGPRLHPTRMVRQGPWKFIYTHGMRDQLFHTTNDPHELHDLAGDPGHADTLRRLRYLGLRDWELDAQPQLSLRAERRADGIALSWASAGAGAAYDVWREPAQGDPELLAAGLTGHAFTDASGGLSRYRVVMHPALTRPFNAPDGGSRYGHEPVLAAEYPDFLPVTPLLVLPDGEASAAAHYRPWHSLDLGAQPWIYEGMPPAAHDGQLHATGPCAILTPRFVREDFALKLNGLSIVWKTGVPADEQVLEFVFGWDNAACTHAFAVDASGMIRLVKRTPDISVLAEANLGTFTGLTVTRQGATFAFSADGRQIISGDVPGLPSGRVGLNLGLGVAEVSTRLALETAVAGDGDATLL